MQELRTLADLERLLAESHQRPVMVLKHSTTCPNSARAWRHWQSFATSPEASRVGLAWVRVIESRRVSLELSRRVGVRHESPQAILIRNGRGIWHRSHRGITAEALREAAASAQ